MIKLTMDRVFGNNEYKASKKAYKEAKRVSEKDVYKPRFSYDDSMSIVEHFDRFEDCMQLA